MAWALHVLLRWQSEGASRWPPGVDHVDPPYRLGGALLWALPCELDGSTTAGDAMQLKEMFGIQ